MIRSATISDSDTIAKELWNAWHKFKIRQIPTPMHSYASSEALAAQIRHDLSRWLVCEPSGFFSFDAVGDDEIYQRWRFPARTVRIDQFACLLTGEAILQQLQLLASCLPAQSILLVIPSSLRDAYWAATKAGFRPLGNCPLIIGSFVWLYLDREDRYDEIQAKLRKARVVV